MSSDVEVLSSIITKACNERDVISYNKVLVGFTGCAQPPQICFSLHTAGTKARLTTSLNFDGYLFIQKWKISAQATLTLQHYSPST
jgi:hypothetical protein